MARALVLGGYGLIGAACLRALADAGFQVTGIGRSASAARQADPRADWVICDLTRVSTAEWQALLAGVDVVVNAAGALQDGPRDDLAAIHVTLVTRLAQAAAGLPLRLIQVSAAGAAPGASTAFFRTKAAGDAVLEGSALDWVILRPTLVLAPEAYGGTALLRAAAALPGLVPQVLPQARIQTVALADVALAVVAAARGQVPAGTAADLTETASHSLPGLTLALRRWLGLPPPRFQPALPGWLLGLAGRAADGLGRLGWRSPLRRTALAALAEGIRGDPAPWAAAGGAPCRALAETLAAMPATRADRLAARSYLALPVALGVLALFWLVSGLVALADTGAAEAVLKGRGTPPAPARVLVLGGALADIGLGLAILWRPAARVAALGMAGLSAAYLAGGLALAPDLWADPLGPMVKVLPGIALALWVWLVLEDR